MTASWARLLFPERQALFYRVKLAGRTCIEQWTVYHGEVEGGLHRLTFMAEIDRTALGNGVGKIQARGDLLCTAALEPVRYDFQGGGSFVQLRFVADQVLVTLPDGTNQRIDNVGPAYLSDGNFPATVALVYASVAGEVPSVAAEHLRIKLFIVNTLVTVPYETYPAEEPEKRGSGWHRTSHRSEVRLDPAGVMLAARLPDNCIEATMLRDAPPVPDWPALLEPPPPFFYQPPPGAEFRLEDVEIDGPVTPIGATLSIPPGPGPFPAVLFISGSGAHDRHGIAGQMDIGTHELMDDLARHGFLGLRFDTRGAGTTKLGADILDRGLNADIADARACLAYLSVRPEALGQPLALIGHSQGATVAMALAGEPADSRLCGVVLMAGMGRDVDDVLADQVEYQGRWLGLGDAQIEALQADTRKVAELIRSGSDWDEAQVPHHLLATFRTQTWYRDFLCNSPADLIGRVGCPILLCQGGADFQISPERDAERLLATAREAGKDCTYMLFPGLDHLFKRSAGASSLTEYYIPRPVDPEFLTRLRTWLASRAGLRA